jgi:MFS family permease
MLVLLTLAAGQFLITLDTSVMNVSIATVAKDVDTTVTGIQGAITAYTLVMAALMITGAKIGAMIGRKRAFVSDADLPAALKKANVDSQTSEQAMNAYRDARIKGLKSALAILSLLVLVALFYAQRIPSTQPGAAHDPEPAPA